MVGPRNVQYAPKTPLIKGVNPSLYGFGCRPRFGSLFVVFIGNYLRKLIAVEWESNDGQIAVEA